MTTGPMPPVDHHDVGVAVLDQGVHEPHPECPRAYDEVVSLNLGTPTHTYTYVRVANPKVVDEDEPFCVQIGTAG